jgi:hypothetical protein
MLLAELHHPRFALVAIIASVLAALVLLAPGHDQLPPEPQPEPPIVVPHWGMCGFDADVQAHLAYERGDLARAIEIVLEDAKRDPEPAAYKYDLGALYAELEWLMGLKSASALERAMKIDAALGGRFAATIEARLRALE